MKYYNFNHSIFKAYDIRGRVSDTEITEEASYFIGLSLGRLVQKGAISVGFDARQSSPTLASHLSKGIIDSGIDVINIGLVPTPVSYFSNYSLEVKASVMITGSHNPPEYNGFKIMVNNKSLSGEDLKQLIKFAENGIEVSGNVGSVRDVSLIDQYCMAILKQLKFGSKKLKIGIDAMNGSGGVVLKNLLKLLPFEVILKNCESSGDFSEFTPEPSKQSSIESFKAFIQKENLDLLFCFDGDADRVLLITKDKVWYGDDITLLLAYIIIPENKGRKVIFDIKSSIVLEEEIIKFGGVPVIYKTGHSLIKQKMQEENAILAGEMSGHIYINDDKFFAFDDGINCFLRVMEYASKHDLPHFAETFKTSEIKLKVSNKDDFISTMKHTLLKQNPSKVLEIDGIKAYFNNNTASFLIRKSNTEDVVIVRIEAKDKSDFDFLNNLYNSSKEKI